MVVKTKQVFAPFEESDGERYLITRHYAARPKSMKDLHIAKWIRELAPRSYYLTIIKAFHPMNIHLGLNRKNSQTQKPRNG